MSNMSNTIRSQKIFGGVEFIGNSLFKNFAVEHLEKDPEKVEIPGKVWFNKNDRVFRCTVTVKDGNKESIVIRTLGSVEELNNYINKLKSTKGGSLISFKGEKGPNGLFEIKAGDGQNVLKQLVNGIDADRKSINGIKDDVAGLHKQLQEQKSTEDKEIKDLKDYVDGNFLSTTKTKTQNVKSPVVFEKSITVKGDILIGSGKLNEIEVDKLKVSDNTIILNSNVNKDHAPTESAGIEVNRGAEGVMPLIEWNEDKKEIEVATGKKDKDGNYIVDKIATITNVENAKKEATEEAGKEAKTNDQNLRKEINAIRFIFESTLAKREYNIAHNLETPFVNTLVWVYDEMDGKWYNDKVTVGVIDDNNLDIILAEPAKMRLVVTNVSHQF